jgi:hypothetical protein
MTKNDVKTYGDLINYAEERARDSLQRNDPLAVAYWRESAAWADEKISEGHRPWPPDYDEIRSYVEEAQQLTEEGRYMDGALFYSRAKWLVIMGRNNGFVMNPEKTGVNLSWLREEFS